MKKKLPALPLSSLPILILALALAFASAAQAQTSVPGFSKSFHPSTIGPGSVSTLRFDITNGSSTPVRDLAFTDNLPAGMTVATPAQVSSTCGGTLSAPEGGGTITLSSGGVGIFSSCRILVDVTSATPGTHTNVTGDLTSDAGNSGPATADLTVATDRPGFRKSFSPDTVLFGGRSVLTFTIDNTANTSAMANLRFTDNLPSGMVVASPANASNTCGGGSLSAPAGANTISYAPVFFGDATIAAGASCQISVAVLGNAVGVLANTTGDLSSTPPFGGSTRSSGKAGATLTVTVERIALTKRFTDDPVPPGGTVTLEFTVRNLERDSSATSISFTDDLDAVLSGLTAVGLPISDPCGAGSQLSGTGLLSLTGGNLDPGATCTFGVSVQVPAAAASGVYTNTTSAITADLGGRPVTGDPATDLLFVEPVPLLAKSFVDDPVGGGGSVTLEFSITNTSSTSAATDIAFVDVFDVVLPTASDIPAGGFCGAGSTANFTPLIDTGSFTNPATLTISGASLAAGASCTFGITLDVIAGAPAGLYPNTTSEITATVDGATRTGNPASDDLQIVATPDLSKEFVDDPVAPGDTVTLRFTLEHDEFAPGDATGITFSDDLDAALAGLVATGLPASDVCGVGSSISGGMTLLFSGGTLAPGESCSFDVTLQVPSTAPPGPHTNTTSAVVATVLGVEAVGFAATDDLRIAGLTLNKEFIDDPVLPGGTVTLRYTIANDSPTASASEIFFSDNMDSVVDNLAATNLPLADICGTGSSMTATSGNTRLTFLSGALGPGESCSFDVTLQVPTGTEDGIYSSLTNGFSANIDGTLILFDNAADELTVESNFLEIAKEFTDDPASPGDNVTLRFTLTNLNASQAIDKIVFSDDLDAALAGLASVSGTLSDVCGAGSQITGTGLLSFSGGTLAAGASCTFDVSLAVPASVPLGTVATNVTSAVTGMLGGLEVQGDPASDDLRIDFLAFGKMFGDVVHAGDIVSLTFTIANLSTTEGVSDISFLDDLDAVLPGLEAIGLPEFDACGEGSEVTGTSLLLFNGGSLLPGGTCTFSVDLQVPETAAAGSYLNVTSDLLLAGTQAAQPATATLTVIEVADDDDDGVLNADDVCAGTVIPESVPTRTLRPNRYALVDGDTTFDTVVPPGGGPGEVFTTTDTAGCSCEQIIDALGLGQGHVKFGCSLGAMRQWVALVSGARRLQSGGQK